MYFNIISDLYDKTQFLPEEEQKKFLQYIFDNQKISSNFEDDISDYIHNVLIFENYFNDFIIQLLVQYDNNDKYIFGLFSHCVDLNNKSDFITILTKSKDFFFFQNNFYKFQYSNEEIIYVRSLFNFSKNSIDCYTNTDYGLKRDIFDVFGIIPKLLCFNYKIENKDQLDFRFLIKIFPTLDKIDQLNIIIKTFSIEQNKNMYPYFYKKLEKENNDIIFSLFTQKIHDLDIFIFLNTSFDSQDLNYSHLYQILLSYKDFSNLLPSSIVEKINSSNKDSSHLVNYLVDYLFLIFKNDFSDYYSCKSHFLNSYPKSTHLKPIFEEYETLLNIESF